MIEWVEIDGYLKCDLTFDTFSSAIKFIHLLAQAAEEMNHHPDFHLYSYKYLSISLKTHSKNAITNLDYKLAEQLTSIYLQTKDSILDNRNNGIIKMLDSNQS
jgi:4a-hydroxytetrahydrobiopterin dehydratase